MRKTTRVLALSVALFFTAASCGAPPKVPHDPTAALAAVEQASHGQLGVEAVWLETGRRVSFHGRESFALASTFKVAVAVAVLRAEDRGDFGPQDTVHLTKEDLRAMPGGGLAARFPNGADLSVEALSTAMIEESDNTACDALLRLVGGPSKVMATLTELGIVGLRVDRSELELSHDAKAGAPVAADDPRDQTTPRAMTDLLALIVRGKATSPPSTRALLGWLEASKPGPMRIRAGLPANARLAHKTGTSDHATNDVGIVTLPDGSRVLIAVYLRDGGATLAERERVLADATRAALDGS